MFTAVGALSSFPACVSLVRPFARGLNKVVGSAPTTHVALRAKHSVRDSFPLALPKNFQIRRLVSVSQAKSPVACRREIIGRPVHIKFHEMKSIKVEQDMTIFVDEFKARFLSNLTKDEHAFVDTYLKNGSDLLDLSKSENMYELASLFNNSLLN